MTDLDDLIARQQRIVDLHEAHQPEHASPIDRGYYEQDKAILARLVSLRDAGKELPEYPRFPSLSLDGEVWTVDKADYDALRAIAEADRARVKYLNEWADSFTDMHLKERQTGDALIKEMQQRAESAESRVRALEAEREAMMAKLREPTFDMLEAGWEAFKSSDKPAPFNQLADALKAMTAAIGGG